MSEKAKNQVGQVRLSSLKAHPRQAEVFHDLPEDEVKALAEDMRQNGQQTPIEIMPDYTIVCGHQRVRAALMLAWEQITAKVRWDLKEQGDAAVFERLVNDNMLRRQLDELCVARCYAALKENAKGLPRQKREAYQKEDLRDRLAKQFNMSGRNLERWVKVLDAPMEVQQAVSKGRLSVAAAGRVAAGSKEVKKKIADEVRAGQDPEEVVRRHLPKPALKKVNNFDAVLTFFRHLRTDVPDVAARTGRMLTLDAEKVALLEQTRALIDDILQNWKREEASPARQAAGVPAGVPLSQAV